KPDIYNRTPLWHAAYHGHIKVIEHILASERKMDLTVRSNSVREPNTTAKQIAKQVGHVKVAKLLAAYEADPMKTRGLLRRKLRLGKNDFFFFKIFLIFLNFFYIFLNFFKFF